jgi:hypothetical protein
MHKLKAIFPAVVIILTCFAFQAKAPEPKSYTVTLPLQKWVGYANGIDYTREKLMNSDLPAREVRLILDSVLNPLQVDISRQINEQIKADSAVKKK